MEYFGIIFDLDGVICFTDELHYLAWKKIADAQGIPFDRTVNNRLRGVSRMASLEIILEKASRPYTQEDKLALAEEKNAYYRELLADMSPSDVSDEVRETLQALRSKGVKLAIGSSSKNTRFILGQIGLESFFDAISDGNNITHSKPDPEVFLKAAEYLELPPKSCLVVEDAEAGIDAACAGGFDSAGLGEASRYARTTYPMQSFRELLNILAK